jgi:hypothetical protein
LNWLCCKHSSCIYERKARACSGNLSLLWTLCRVHKDGQIISIQTFHARCTDFVNSGADNRVWYPGTQSSLPCRSLSQISTQDISKVDLLHEGWIHICSFQSS